MKAAPYALLSVLRLMLLVGIVGAVCAPRALAEEEPGAKVPRGDLRKQVDAQVEPYITEKYLMGLVVGVVDKDGKYVFGYGRRSAEMARPPGQDTVYEIGSISKVFTGVLLAALAQDGSVRLDQPIEALLPDGVTMPKHGEREITLLDLSTHTSALPRMPSNFAPADPANPYADYTPEKMYAFLKDLTLERAPGEQYAYSNLGAGLLGHGLARKAGKSYDELLFERITQPLGMPNTAVALSDTMRKRLARPHDVALMPNKNWDLGTFAGAGGIRSSVRDMLTFARANLSTTDTPVSMALALARERHFEKEGKGPPMGLGWHGDAEGGLGHNGQTGGYHSYLGINGKRGQAVVVLCNTAAGTVSEIGRIILRTIAGEKVEPPKVAKTANVEAQILDTYVGRYEMFPNFVLTVTREGDGLAVQATDQPKMPVYARSDAVFAYRAVKAEITFEKDADGTVTGLVLFQNGKRVPAKRLAD